MAENGTQLFAELEEQRPLRQDSEIRVMDHEGFLCRITMDADFRLTPTQLMTVFSNPDNTGVFRDIYAVPYREVVEDDGEGRQKVIVEQVSGFKFLVVPITFSTHLNVERSMRKGTFRYWLHKKGIMKKFAGEWFLFPIYSPDEPDKIIGTRAMLIQDLLPNFVPIFCAGFMKNISKRAVQRIVEDIEVLTEKYHNGISFDELLKPTTSKHDQKAMEPQDAIFQQTEVVE